MCAAILLRGLAVAGVLFVAGGAFAQTASGSTPPAGAPAQGADVASDEESRPTERLDFGALPLLNYNADNGVGLGANAQVFARRGGYRPFQYSLKAQVFFTTGGLQDHSLTADAPTFLGSPYRLSGLLVYHSESGFGYHGVTNFPELLPQAPPDGKHFNALYLSALRFQAKVQRYLSSHWRVAGSYYLVVETLRPYADSLFSQQFSAAPQRGWYGELRGEVSYDTRNIEASPERGVYAGVGLVVAPPVLGSWAYESADFWVQGYHSFFARPYLVLAVRAQGKAMMGSVPVNVLSGLGGSGTLRGIPSNEYAGPRSLLLNFEVRSRFVRFRPGGHTLDFWAVGFVDVGRVWVPGDFQVQAPALGFHASTGGGLRLAWEEDFVIRFDVGWSRGPLRTYLDFGQVF